MSTEQVIYEAAWRPAHGKAIGRTVLELYFYFLLAAVIVLFTREVSIGTVLTMSVGLATVFAALLWLMSLGRVQVTPLGMRIRSWRGTKTVPREDMAHVVHVMSLEVVGSIEGYLAVLDHDGNPLWRSVDNYWDPKLVRTLGRIAAAVTTVPSLTPEEVRSRWPRLLPWVLAHPGWAMLATVVVMLLVLGLLSLAFLMFLTA